MRFQVAKQDLDAALQVVNPSLSGSGGGIETHYVFRRTGPDDAGKYGVVVLTNSGLLSGSCPLIVSVDDPGTASEFTVEGGRLKQFLAHVPDTALTFTFDDKEKETVVRAVRATQSYPSLAADYRYDWGDLLKEAKHTATLPADRVAGALSYSRRFAAPENAKRPELCVCEIKGGILFSTDQKGVTLVRLKELEESSLRVHSKDVSGFLGFLAACEGTSVDVLEHDRKLIFRRHDGAVFAESRFGAEFPDFEVEMDEEPHHKWTLSKDDLTHGIGVLTSGAADSDNRLHLALGTAEGEVVLSMMTTGGKKTEYPIQSIAMESLGGKPPIPDEGFYIDHPCLTKVLSSWKGDNIMLGNSVKGIRGTTRVGVEHDGDEYLTILGWLR